MEREEETEEINQLHSYDIDRRKQSAEKNVSQCLFVHHKSHMDYPRRKTGPPR
jgi:hypothetical protein